MKHSKHYRRKLKRERIRRYTKPFIKRVPALVATNDKRYIRSGRPSSGSIACSHEYCLAERARAFMDGDEDLKPVGLPWASGNLKYLPGHVKITFPLRRNEKTHPEKTKKRASTSPLSQTFSVPDKINNPEMCGTIDEILYAYKVFMLAGMIISEARDYIEDKEDKKDEDDSDYDDDDDV